MIDAGSEAKTAEGFYRFAPDDPAAGPFSGDVAETRSLELSARLHDGQLR